MTTKGPFAHTRFDISLFGIELTEEEVLEMMREIDKFAQAKHPEQTINGSALWSVKKMSPIKDLNPVTLEEIAA